MPENEWPTRTVGPSWRASTRSAEATASDSVVNVFCTEVALTRRLQPRNHFGPARSVGEQSVHQNDIACLCRSYIGGHAACREQRSCGTGKQCGRKGASAYHNVYSFICALEVRFVGAHCYVVSSRAMD